MNTIDYRESDGIAHIALNRPAALNAFNRAMRLELLEALRHAEQSTTARTIVLSGNGRCFSAGADLHEPVTDPDELRRALEDEYLPGIDLLRSGPKPVVCAVHGFATGVALAYVLASDLVVIGEQAFVQVPFARLGLIPDGGLTWLLTRVLGHHRAFELVALGERVAGQRCVELGLANRTAADAEVLEVATALAASLAAGPPIALRAAKHLLRAAPARDFATSAAAEVDAQVACVQTEDLREGLEAFRQRRPPRFQGR